MDRTTFVVKTLERPEELARLIQSMKLGGLAHA